MNRMLRPRRTRQRNTSTDAAKECLQGYAS